MVQVGDSDYSPNCASHKVTVVCIVNLCFPERYIGLEERDLPFYKLVYVYNEHKQFSVLDEERENVARLHRSPNLL